jgi:hypothetical protein
MGLASRLHARVEFKHRNVVKLLLVIDLLYLANYTAS